MKHPKLCAVERSSAGSTAPREQSVERRQQAIPVHRPVVGEGSLSNPWLAFLWLSRSFPVSVAGSILLLLPRRESAAAQWLT